VAAHLDVFGRDKRLQLVELVELQTKAGQRECPLSVADLKFLADGACSALPEAEIRIGPKTS
jgi:hypothetical protein